MSALRTPTRLAVCLLAGLLVLGVAAPAAQAQQDPYGSTTTTTQPGVRVVEATLDLDPDRAKVGDTVVATVGGVFFGESVEILFDGVVVGRGQAPDVVGQAAGAAVAFNGAALPAQSDDVSTTIKISFTVPNASPGPHKVFAVGETFAVDADFTVIAAAGSSKLPRTGIYVGLLLAVAAALVLGGRAFIAASRVRRRTSAAFLLDEDDDELLTSGRR